MTSDKSIIWQDKYFLSKKKYIYIYIYTFLKVFRLPGDFAKYKPLLFGVNC